MLPPEWMTDATLRANYRLYSMNESNLTPEERERYEAIAAVLRRREEEQSLDPDTDYKPQDLVEKHVTATNQQGNVIRGKVYGAWLTGGTWLIGVNIDGTTTSVPLDLIEWNWKIDA